jgi:hypothetical protein
MPDRQNSLSAREEHHKQRHVSFCRAGYPSEDRCRCTDCFDSGGHGGNQRPRQAGEFRGPPPAAGWCIMKRVVLAPLLGTMAWPTWPGQTGSQLSQTGVCPL